MALGDRAAFSAATIDRGRLRGRSDASEGGRRCCQLSGEFLEGIALDGEAFIETGRSFSVREGPFSFVGEAETPVNRSIASLIDVSRPTPKFVCGSIVGEIVWDKLLGSSVDCLVAVGVLAGEDFVGEIDLARSEVLSVQDVKAE